MSLFNRVKKVKSRWFMEAVAAGSAMVAFADGMVRPEEVEKLMEYARLDESLKVFNPLEVEETFGRYIERFEFDPQIGKDFARKAIRKIDRNSEEARLLVLICCAIGGADGDFDNNQRLAVRDICKMLGLDVRRFDLELRAPTLADLAGRRKVQPPGRDRIPAWMKNQPPPLPESKPKPEEKKLPEDLPDWMRNPPEIPGGDAPVPKPEPKPEEDPSIPEWMKNPAVIRQVPPQNPDDAIPDWMKNPPFQPDKAPSEGLPDWMRNSPKQTRHKNRKKRKKAENDLPDWMKP